MRIKVQNFQSIAKADLEISGLTVITGESDIGKTAVLRAVAAVVFGLPGDYYIRDGETACGVRLEDENLSVKWIKTTRPTPKIQNGLEINGVVHSRAARDHADLLKVHGFRELKEIKDLKANRPQFARQDDGVFLVSETEGTRAEVLRLLSRADVAATAQKKARGDLRDVEGRTDLRKLDLDLAFADTVKLDYVPTVRQMLVDVKTEVIRSEQVRTVCMGLIEKLRRYASLTPVFVPKPPTVPVIASIVGTIESLRRLIALGQSRVVPKPPILDPTTIKEANRLLDCLSKLNSLTLQVETLKTERHRVSSQIDDVAEARSALEKELGVCPVCDRGF